MIVIVVAVRGRLGALGGGLLRPFVNQDFTEFGVFRPRRELSVLRRAELGGAFRAFVFRRFNPRAFFQPVLGARGSHEER